MRDNFQRARRDLAWTYALALDQQISCWAAGDYFAQLSASIVVALLTQTLRVGHGIIIHASLDNRPARVRPTDRTIDGRGRIKSCRRLSRIFWQRAPVERYPASHEGLASSYFFISMFLRFCPYGAVDLIDQGGALINTGLPCKPHIRRDLRPHHGPAFGTGELQEGGATL